MTEEIIDVTKCEFNTFDGGGSQRTICTLDNCFCDGIRPKECYFKQLKRFEQLKNKYYQQTLDDEITISDLITKCNDLEQENEALAFRERLYKADYEASEQENKELKKQIESQKGLIKAGGKAQNEYIKEIAELKQENEQLKAENTSAGKLIFEQVINCRKNDNYRKALERIREDITGFCVECQDECKQCTVHEIKTQIDEVLG